MDELIDGLEKKLIEIVQLTLKEGNFTDEGIELYDIEWKGNGGYGILRVFLNKPSGITIDDCANVSKHLSVMLNVEDPIPHPYRLEVSSPGGRKKRNLEEIL